MFMRVLVVVAILNQPLAVVLAWSIGTMGAVVLAASVILWFVAAKSADGSKVSNEVSLKNLFSIGPATEPSSDCSARLRVMASTSARPLAALAKYIP